MSTADLQLERIVRRVLAVMLVGVALYGGFVLYSGFSDVGARFGSFAWWTFAAACGLASVNYLLRFLKWEFYLGVLGIRGVPKGESLLTFLSGFVLTVSPGKVGEVFKSLVLYRTRGVPVERSAPIVVAERVTDLIAVIVMIAVGSLGFRGGLVWAGAGATLVIILLVFVASPTLSRRAVAWAARLPGPLGRIGTRLRPRLETALDQLRELCTPARLVLPALLSVVGWSLEGVGLWLLLRGFGQELPLTLAMFSYATATLAGAIVPLPGGLGITDKLIEQQLVVLGSAPLAVATSAMLLIRFATLWFAVLVGFVALSILRATHPRLQLTPADVSGTASAADGQG
jgi:glycosyltransferase 2 family protein